MSFAKYLLPALAASKLAFASDSCGDTTIASQTDADAITSCTTISGHVTIDESYSGSLDLGSIEKITGNLICNGGSNVTSITAADLVTIGKNFTLEGLTSVTSLSFAALTTIGSIYWEALPELQSLDFTTGVTDVGDINIINTGLTSLDGISLETVGQFDIEDNDSLVTVNINNLMNATGMINFAGNDDSLVIDLPNLSTGTSMTFRNISSISVPSLKKLTGQLGFWGTDFSTFYAPNLTTTSDLVFSDNSKLSNISMPVLVTVDGGFSITGNDALQVIDLPDLETVAGAIDFTGNFYEVEFGSLTTVDGGFKLDSTNGSFSCSKLKSEYESAVKGTWKCNATDPDATSSSSSSSSSGTSSSSSSSSTSSSAALANTIAAPVAGAAALFYAIAQLI
ncbi:Leucine rich repeat 5 [Penicillium malachiteum]|uniref:Leucine rich repeat 5 n=1 Tax=Penicillium malachiteum TaxID=1324776 RepID=A0AAD6MT95_9EURO|nr:Leucine rich repeat 5 [Penicillium malachiteum]